MKTAIYHHAKSRPSGTPEQFIDWFGAKALGLARLPVAATPPFLVLPTAVYEAWLETRVVETALEASGLIPNEFWLQAEELCGPHKIARSSATNESYLDRGDYLSEDVSANGPTALWAAIGAIYNQYEDTDADGQMAIIVQQLAKCPLFGHLSNEHRVAPKPYQWAFETTTSDERAPRLGNTSLSAKQAIDLDLERPILVQTGLELRRALAGIAKWIWRRSPTLRIDRSLLEWGWDGERLWIFQWDPVQESQDGGIDPRIDLVHKASAPRLNEGAAFRRHTIGGSAPWPKLSKLDGFATGTAPPPHRLFYASAAKIDEILKNSGAHAILAEEISGLTGDQAVLRTDSVRGGFNLPKTDTVDGQQAASWLIATIDGLKNEGVDLRDYSFILHQYIVAAAAAWSYHKRGSDLVHVDGLWGLADGLQFLDCDSFVYDTRINREVSRTIRYKAKIMREQPDGSWSYSDVRGNLARQRSLNPTTVKSIVQETIAISNRVNDDVQIMWFCGIPEELQLGSILPWYRAEPQQDISERSARALKPLEIRTVSDLSELKNLDSHGYKIVLEPSPNDVRNPDFINAVAEQCIRLSVPVEMRGSILGHAYHQLRKLGVDVYSAEPTKRPMEVRQRKAFDKLVRDEIPNNITAKGEHVKTYRLQGDDVRRAITGKLVEEAEEFLLAQNTKDQREELADIYELVVGLAANLGVSIQDIDEEAKAKRKKRGGFMNGIVRRETSTRVQSSGEQELFESHDPEKPPVRPLSSSSRVQSDNGRAVIPIDLLLGAQSPTIVGVAAHGDDVRFRVSLSHGKVTIELLPFDKANQDRLL